MRLLGTVTAVVAVVLALVVLVRGRLLLSRQPSDPRVVRALAVAILAFSLSVLVRVQLEAGLIAGLLVAFGGGALVAAFSAARR
jgi:hypothetical protein